MQIKKIGFKFLARIFLLLILISGISLFLISCGKGNGSGVTTLRYMRWGTPEELAAERELMAIFEKENPDIKIKLEVSAWSEYWTKLQAQLTARAAPDVFLLSGTYLYDFVEKGVLVDLSEMVEQDDFDLSLYFSNPVEIFRYKGGLWGLPRDCNTVVLVFNRTLFQKYGVAEPTADWTWDDFLKAAQHLTLDSSKDGRIDTWGYTIIPDSMETQTNSFIWANGGQVLNTDRTRCMLDQPPAIEAIQFLVDLIHKYKVAPDIPSQAVYGGNMFLTGKFAMVNGGSWAFRTYRNIERFEWDIAPLPGRKVKAAPVNGLGNGIYARSRYKDEAWRLVKFLSGKTYQENLARAGTSIPGLKEVAYSDAFLKAHNRPKNIRAVLDQLEYATPLDFTPNSAQWNEVVLREYNLAWLQRKPVEQAARDAARQVNELLATLQNPSN